MFSMLRSVMGWWVMVVLPPWWPFMVVGQREKKRRKNNKRIREERGVAKSLGCGSQRQEECKRKGEKNEMSSPKVILGNGDEEAKGVNWES